MKIEVKARGFRGLERADIEINPVALVCGLNYAGKSSLAQAVAAAVTGSPIPFYRDAKPDKPLLTKADSKLLCRGGMDEGTVEVYADGKLACAAKWPDLTITGNGSLQCSKYAAGILNVMGLPDDERQRFFATLLQAMPTQEDLSSELMEKVPGLGDEKAGEHLKMLLEKVAVSGWDAIHASSKETGARLKGQWEAHSQTKYGSQKADGWLPQGWSGNLAKKSIEDIGAECTQAEARWTEAVAKMAIDANSLAELTAAAGVESAAQAAFKKAKDEDDACARVVAAQKVKIAGCQIPESIPCPECGALLEVKSALGGINISPAMMGPAERDAAIAKLAVERQVLAEIEQERGDVAKQLQAAFDAYRAVKGATENLKAAQEKKGGQEAVDTALDYLNGLRRDKAGIEAVTQCTRLHTLVKANQIIVDILAPEGLRRQKLVKSLDKFNRRFLAALCQEADYPAVTLDNDLEVLYGGRRYFLLSDSEKYRVKAVLQLAIALYDKSPLVIYDGADILDAAGRNGLFSMMQSCESVNFLIAMTMADSKKAPNLGKAGLGATYWITQGIASQIGVETA